MAYDRSGAIFLPNIAAQGNAVDAQVSVVQAAGTQLGGTMTMPCKGRILGLALLCETAFVMETTQGVLGIEINTVEEMTVPLEDNLANDAWQITLGTLVAGKNGEFKAGDTIGVDVSVQGLEGGAEAGTAQIFPIVALDQAP